MNQTNNGLVVWTDIVSQWSNNKKLYTGIKDVYKIGSCRYV